MFQTCTRHMQVIINNDFKLHACSRVCQQTQGDHLGCSAVWHAVVHEKILGKLKSAFFCLQEVIGQ